MLKVNGLKVKQDVVFRFSGTNIIGATSYADFASKLKRPRRAMLMVRATLDSMFYYLSGVT